MDTSVFTVSTKPFKSLPTIQPFEFPRICIDQIRARCKVHARDKHFASANRYYRTAFVNKNFHFARKFQISFESIRKRRQIRPVHFSTIIITLNNFQQLPEFAFHSNCIRTKYKKRQKTRKRAPHLNPDTVKTYNKNVYDRDLSSEPGCKINKQK